MLRTHHYYVSWLISGKINRRQLLNSCPGYVLILTIQVCQEHFLLYNSLVCNHSLVLPPSHHREMENNSPPKTPCHVIQHHYKCMNANRMVGKYNSFIRKGDDPTYKITFTRGNKDRKIWPIILLLNLRISYMKRFCLFDTVHNPGSAREQGKDNSTL